MRFVAFSSLALSFFPSLLLSLCLVCLACSLLKSQLFIIFVVLVYCTFSFAFAFIFFFGLTELFEIVTYFLLCYIRSLSPSLFSLSLSCFIFALSETLCTIAQFVVVVVVYLTQNSFVVCRVCAEFIYFFCDFWRIKSEMPTCKFICEFNICFNVCAVLLYV